jgi:trehalose 6-phosphate synthase
LRRVWLTREEEQGYYYGFSNEALWPMSHMAFRRPVFRTEDWEYYKKVNEKFARVILEEIGDKKAFVWIQDYHLCLLPKYLKELAPSQVITAHFWHIPWPSHETFRICPQKKEILESLLMNDLLGFHIRYHCNNFLEVVDRELECKIDRERHSIIKNNHETLVRPYPISVDFEGIGKAVATDGVKQLRESLTQEFGLQDYRVLLGIDRIDYTKGLPEKLLAIDTLLQRHPELKRKLIFLQIGVISRLHLTEYKNLNDQINALIEDINWRHADGGWRPIIFVRRQVGFQELIALYSLAEVCLVASLHDGMNLVAKEFVASRTDDGGRLVLSQFTGASRELTDAFQINPYDREQFAEEIYRALSINDDEAKRRMAKMRDVVRTNNIYRWAGKNLAEMLKFEFREEAYETSL